MVMSFYNKGDLNNFIKNIHSLGSEVEEYVYNFKNILLIF